jgi:hypothetical protein
MSTQPTIIEGIPVMQYSEKLPPMPAEEQCRKRKNRDDSIVRQYDEKALGCRQYAIAYDEVVEKRSK